MEAPKGLVQLVGDLVGQASRKAFLLINTGCYTVAFSAEVQSGGTQELQQ
jgi:hypothetical protein